MTTDSVTIDTEQADKLRGMMMGLAIGDALGAPLEFMQPGTFTEVKDYIGGGVHGLAPGYWTDDTSMALASTVSLLQCGDFDPNDQAERFLRWYRDGYLSSTGRCFDIGNRTRAALRRFQSRGEYFVGDEALGSAGNGALMRLAPIIIYAHVRGRSVELLARDHARLTHADPRCLESNQVFANCLCNALEVTEREAVWQWSDAFQRPQNEEVRAVVDGSFLRRDPPDIRGNGYVVATLEAALWAFAHSESFEEGMIKAINLGEDADTVGAVYGQLAGAFYGYQAMPPRWRNELFSADAILRLTDALIYGNGMPQVGVPASWF